MIAAASLIGIGFVGAVVWVVNTEATAVYYGVELGWNPLLVGFLLAFGQLGMHLIFFFFGDRLVRRWKWLQKQVEVVQHKWGNRLEQRYLMVTVLAAIFGVPPSAAICVLAPSFGMTLIRFIPVVFVCRIVRFSTLAYFGLQLGQWFSF